MTLIERLELVDFRNYSSATFELTTGTTVVVGDNGQGKTNLAEALAYLATLSSFRGVANDALVKGRRGERRWFVPDVRDDDGRESLVEAEITPTGRGRVQVNRQRLARTRDCSECCVSPCSRQMTWRWSRVDRLSADTSSTTAWSPWP